MLLQYYDEAAAICPKATELFSNIISVHFLGPIFHGTHSATDQVHTASLILLTHCLQEAGHSWTLPAIGLLSFGQQATATAQQASCSGFGVILDDPTNLGFDAQSFIEQCHSSFLFVCLFVLSLIL